MPEEGRSSARVCTRALLRPSSGIGGGLVAIAAATACAVLGYNLRR